MSDELITAEVVRAVAIAIGKRFHDPKAKPNEDALAALFELAAKDVCAALPALIEKARGKERERAAEKADAVAARNQAIVDQRPMATATGLPFDQALANYLAAGGVGAAREIAAAIRARTQPETQEPTP